MELFLELWVTISDKEIEFFLDLDISQSGNYTETMHVISRKTLSDYWQKVPESELSLRAWFSEAQKAQWTSPADIKEKYRSASFLKGNRVVFNICGNKHRLIVRIHYESKTVFVRFVGTHSEYDKINAEEV